MTEQQKDSAIKKINERYTDICRQFGKDSGIARDYRNSMELAVGEENLHKAAARSSSGSKRRESAADMGIDLISRNKSVLASVSDDDLNALLSKHTAGDIKKAAKEEAKREEEETGDRISYKDVLEAMDFVYEVEEDDPDEMYYAIEEYWNTVGAGNPKPTYTTLCDIIKAHRAEDKARDNGNQEKADKIRGKMLKKLDKLSRTAQEVYF